MKLKALKIRIYPNVQQTTLLNKTFGCSRFIYNTMLSERKCIYAKLKDKPRELYEYKYRTEKQLKEEFEFLKEVDSISLQQPRMNLRTSSESLKIQKFQVQRKDFQSSKRRMQRILLELSKSMETSKQTLRRKKSKLQSWDGFHIMMIE